MILLDSDLLHEDWMPANSNNDSDPFSELSRIHITHAFGSLPGDCGSIELFIGWLNTGCAFMKKILGARWSPSDNAT